MKNAICLFDMDGTLTPPRKKAGLSIVRKLKELSRHMHIGIVTGSDYDYVMQQCGELFDIGGVPVDKIDLFPCNGTKHYKFKSGGFKLIHDVNMIEKIGQENYNYIMQTLLASQLTLAVQHKIPYTGTFFQYRGSMLNWCPIGRQAGDVERAAWCEVDSKHLIREHYMKQINDTIKKNEINLTVALGGSTSFDIYPTGWDKTYVLNHLSEFNDVYFVGDRCQEGGNDKALYDVLTTGGYSFETTGPSDTIKIIDQIVKRGK